MNNLNSRQINLRSPIIGLKCLLAGLHHYFTVHASVVSLPQSIVRRYPFMGMGRFRMMPGFLIRLPKVSLRHPRRMLAFVGLIALVCLPGMMRLRLRTDGLALVSPSAAEVVIDKRVRDQFHLRDKVAVVIRSKTGKVFNPATLQTVRDLTAEFRKLAGVSEADVMSLATEPGMRRRPGTMTTERLLEAATTNMAECNQLRDDLEKLKLYTGTLVSMDGGATIILIGIPEEAERAAFLRDVRRAISKQASAENEIGLTGAPVAEVIFGAQILRDLGVPTRLLDSGVDEAFQKSGLNETKGALLQRLVSCAGRIGLVPLAAAVMVVVLVIFFHSFTAALVPLPGVMATMLFVLGVMGWVRVPIYLTTAVMPVLLTVMSVTNDIYLFARYFTLVRRRPTANHIILLEETFENLAAPVIITSLSAVAGFLSFAASPLTPVKAFGIFTALGALFSLLLSLTAVPALLALISPSRFISQRETTAVTMTKHGAGFEGFATFVLRHRWWVIGVTGLCAALTPFGISRLSVQDSWMSGFGRDSEFRRLTTEVDRGFLGSHLLLVSFDAPEFVQAKTPRSAISGSEVLLPGNVVEEPITLAGSLISLSREVSTSGNPQLWQGRIEMADHAGTNIVVRAAGPTMGSNFWNESVGGVVVKIPVRTQLIPKTVQRIDAFEKFVREQTECSVGGVLGAPDYLSTIRFIAREAGPGGRGLPETAVDAGILWDYYRVSLGQARLRQVVSDDYSRTLLTIFLKDANFADTARLMGRIRDYERQHLASEGIKLDFAGDVAVSQSLIQGIVSTQMQSLIWSSLGIFVLIAVLGGSWIRGLWCMMPSVLAVAVKFALMGWAGIALGVATSMFAAMTLGIGVNCAIHLFEGRDRAISHGASNPEAWIQALRGTGPAALVNTIAICLGFGVLMLSPVPANSRLGILLVLGLATCSVISLTLLPALLGRSMDQIAAPDRHRR